MLSPSIPKNDRVASLLIGVVSLVVFATIVVLGRVELKVELGFDPHLFATLNAFINSCVAILLVAALVAVKKGKYPLHKNLMLIAMLLSILFLVSYIAHHLLSGSTIYGDVNHDGVLDDTERSAISSTRGIYVILLLTHILSAAIILPFVLFTAYRGLTSEFPQHRKLAKITWPIWFYVSVTGPIVYWMISPFYG